MRYFSVTSDTSGTRNTANSSDASKTSASVTRLSNYSRKNIASNITLGFKLKKKKAGLAEEWKRPKMLCNRSNIVSECFFALNLVFDVSDL